MDMAEVESSRFVIFCPRWFPQCPGFMDVSDLVEYVLGDHGFDSTKMVLTKN